MYDREDEYQYDFQPCVGRAEEIERRTGSIMNALALVQEAVERFVPIDGHLDKISMSLEELHDFVYIWGIDRNQISKGLLGKVGRW